MNIIDFQGRGVACELKYMTRRICSALGLNRETDKKHLKDKWNYGLIVIRNSQQFTSANGRKQQPA